MKTTKTFFLATTTLLLSLFATSCIPTVPTGGNPTPTPQTDTTVVYRLVNWQVQDNYVGDSIDLDSNNINDLRIDNASFVTNTGVSNIYSINGAELGRKDGLFGDLSSQTFDFTSNDLINNSYFTESRLELISSIGSTKNYIIGFRLLQNDGFHYGWMNVKFTTSSNFGVYQLNTTLVNYAYKIAPNTPILAGKY